MGRGVGGTPLSPLINNQTTIETNNHRRKKMQVTPEQCGASQLACNIINNTFLALDGFEPLRKQIENSETNGVLTFASELARVADREIKQQQKIDQEKALEGLGQLFGIPSDSQTMKLLKASNTELSC